MLTKTKEQEIEAYLPANCAQIVNRWLNFPNVKLRISRHRSSKLGDYRPLYGGKRHVISVNGTLNKYAFLLTLVHEIAHMHIYMNLGNKVKPHGQEWKNEFKLLMSEFDMPVVFPEDLISKIETYMGNPKASSSSDVQLSLAFRNYDAQSDDSVVLSDISIDTLFVTLSGRIFLKGPRQRKRYKCKEVKSGRLYLFSPITEVTPG